MVSCTRCGCLTLLAALQLMLSATTTSGQSECRLHFQGNSRGAIAIASMRCTGSSPAAAVDEQLLGTLKSSFQGVRWDDRCSTPGCLLTICGGSHAVIMNSNITGVQHDGLQSLLCVANSSVVEVRASMFAHNSARAVYACNKCSVTVNASRMAFNSIGGSGAGVAALDNAHVLITGSRVEGNVADAIDASGGGVAAGGNAHVTITGSSIVANNTSTMYMGGGVSASDNATVVVNGSSRIDSNNAHRRSGGGVAALNSSTVVVSGKSVVSNNVCGSVGAGLVALDNATVLLTGASRVESNGNRGNTSVGRGGGMSGFGNAHITISGSSVVAHNKALFGGGGLHAVQNATFVIADSSRVEANRATDGAGLIAYDNSNVTLTGRSVVSANTASQSGGGMAALFNTTVLITNDSRVENNFALRGGGGGVLAGNNSKITVSGNSTISGNTCVSFNGGGVAARGRAFVLITDGSRVTSNRAINSNGGGIAVTENAALEVAQDAVLANNSVVNTMEHTSDKPDQGLVGADIATWQASVLTIADGGSISKCSRRVHLGRTPCDVGERALFQMCDCCQIHTFSFSNGTCEQCPANAQCPGGDQVLPIAGYWHSSARSVKMHRCPLFTDACGDFGVCKPGYQGNLCGACAPGYGIVTRLRCAQCMKPQRQLAFYIMIMCATVFLVASTVHFTWRDNLEGSTDVRPTDLIKVMVLFLQYLVIIGSVSVPWPATLRTLFASASVVFQAASGQALSLDCWLFYYARGTGSVPLAIQRQLVGFVAPVVVFTAVVLVLLLSWAVKLSWLRGLQQFRRYRVNSQQTQLLLLRKLPVTAMVVGYYAYPTLVKASLGFFACIHIDDVHGPYPQYALANSSTGYWASDIQQACFEGWHKAWSLSLGIVSALLLLSVPGIMWWFLKANQSKADHPDFREHFGFLYRNFASTRVWWEAVWALQTVLLVTVSVFHFTFRAYYSLLLLNLIFLSSAALQAIGRPYAHITLHRLHLTSTSCLLLTTWCALVLFTVDSAGQALANVQSAVGVLAVIMDAGFVVWCMYLVVASALRKPLQALKMPLQTSLSKAFGRCGSCRRFTRQIATFVAQAVAAVYNKPDRPGTSVARE